METIMQLPKVFSQMDETIGSTYFLIRTNSKYIQIATFFAVQNYLSTLCSERKRVTNEKSSTSKRQNTRRNKYTVRHSQCHTKQLYSRWQLTWQVVLMLILKNRPLNQPISHSFFFRPRIYTILLQMEDDI